MKTYIKPELYYERYEVSQHIADCQWELKFGDLESCVANPDPDFWGEGYPEKLAVEGKACTITGEELQNYCYQNGADGVNIFQS